MRFPRSGQIRIIIVLVAINLVIMAALTALSPTFLTYGNIIAVLTRMSELGMLAIAETVVLISGGFDISIGSVMALSGAVLGTLHVMGMPFFFVITISLLVGIAVGLLNAFLVVHMRLTPFIVTLATMAIVRSVVYALLKGNVFTDLPENFLNLYYMQILRLPVLFIILVATAVIIAVFIRRTVMGRRIFAIGGNERTAYISGIFVKRIRYFVYSLSGFICALAGLLFTARIRAVIPDAGINAPLEVITAVLIGGTTIYGGKGSVLGSLLGILAMYLLLNGFSLLGLNPFWEVIMLGIILIFVIGQEGIVRSFKTFLSPRKD
jgi:ribose transport system permease protein